MKITNEKLYYLCNKYRWFTAGDNKQYEKLFWKNRNGATLEQLALIIWLCSSNAEEHEILEILNKEYDIR